MLDREAADDNGHENRHGSREDGLLASGGHVDLECGKHTSTHLYWRLYTHNRVLLTISDHLPSLTLGGPQIRRHIRPLASTFAASTLLSAAFCGPPPAAAAGSAALTVSARPLKPVEANQLPAIEVLVYGASASECIIRVEANNDRETFGGLILGTRGGGAWYWQVAAGRPASEWTMTVRCRSSNGKVLWGEAQTVDVKRTPGPTRRTLITAGSLYTNSDVSNGVRVGPMDTHQLQHSGIGGLNAPTFAVSRK